MYRGSKERRGFALVELLVTLGILVLLLAVVIPQMNKARADARDKARVSEIASLQLALRVYFDAETAYPNYPNGVVIGEGAAIDAELAPYLPSIPQDPLGPGSSTYRYYYDSDHDCDGNPGKIVLFVQTMEGTGEGNWDAICNSSGQDGSPTADTYGVIIR